MENSVWQNLEEAHVVAVGGGFDLDLISKDRKVLWVRRDSDSSDRIFLDRPALTDYKKRFEERSVKFQERADLIYTIPEGLFEVDEAEKKILLGDFENLGGTVTLPKRLYPGTLTEVRDDLMLKSYQTSELLFSVRTGNQYPENTKIDWDIKKPLPKGLKPYIISTHENASAVLDAYQETESILKFCPLVTSWSELQSGIDWQKQDPQKRAFLPRSESGKWNWFRLWMKGKQPLNFWREGSGSALDQPTLWEWLSHPNEAQKFAAVLGAPVLQSFSPTYHKSFFQQWRMPFYRIHIEPSEWNEAFKILDQLGLKAAAVTSPLKFEAGKIVQKSALNTIWKSGLSWQGETTDRAGAFALLEKFNDKKVVVWGGGGVLNVLREVLPKASFYASRTGIVRDNSAVLTVPDVLVWADPFNSIQNISTDWKPSVVVDLSYSDKSPAKLYAQKIKAQYVSGLEMFFQQAKEQQKIWEKSLSSFSSARSKTVN